MSRPPRTPLFAILAAIIALLVLFASLPLLERAWIAASRPGEAAVVRGLAHSRIEKRLRAMGHAGAYRPGGDALLRALMDLVRTEPDRTLRLQAARAIADRAALRPLPADVLAALVEGPEPEAPTDVAAACVEALGRSVSQSPLPPSGVARIQRLLAGDVHGEVQIAAVVAIGEVGLRQDVPDEIPLRLAAIAAETEGPRYDSLGRAQRAVWSLKLIGLRRPLPGAALDVLDRLVMTHADRHVRLAAVWTLETQLAHHSRASTVLRAALGDADPEVRGAASGALGEALPAGPAVEAPRPPPGDRAPTDRGADPALRFAGWLFFAIVAGGIGTLLAFLVYYVARLIVFLTRRRWKALLALGVAVLWVGLGYGLGMTVFMVLMGLGHNRTPPLSHQLLFDLAFAGAVLLYAAVGWGLHLAVRR